MTLRKPTVADRPAFRRDVGKTLTELGVGVGEVSSDSILVCSAARSFDPTTNVLWELEANRSAVRNDVRCSWCQQAVAMSNHMYQRYTALDRKPRVCCGDCLPALVTELAPCTCGPALIERIDGTVKHLAGCPHYMAERMP